MINPFISNNDNYLFRKNYQFVAKPQPVPQPSNYSASKLDVLQSKNPFKPSTTPNITSPIPSRSLSGSRVGLNSPQAKTFLGKNKLLDEADGWKREIENQQRQKLQAYGIEGLRYNAYSTYMPKTYDYKPAAENHKYTHWAQQNRYQQEKRKQNEFSDYYQSTKPNNYAKEISRPPPESSYQRGNKLEDRVSFRKDREQFIDEIYESQVRQAQKGRRKQSQKYEGELDHMMQQSKKSRLGDMFGSVMSNGFKQTINHYSYVSYNNNADQFVESKPSKFVVDTFQRINYLEESAVKNVQVSGPPTLIILGTTYHKIQL